MTFALVMASALLAGCVSKPEGITPVDNFNATRYQGKWYEIARFDHRFERGLSNVTADYRARDDGGIKVINRGYKDEKSEWTQSEGKAYFVESPDIGYLKVSFFGPFYGSYVVMDLDRENYSWSLVTGNDKDYLWILSRTPTMDEATKKRLVDKAQALGYDTSKLIWVDQTRNQQASR
ncbi:lipocalin family protein [Massilia sp. PAMC28688]|nr:lipocalin family protein [Massilia sp. PAMC28688]